MRVLALLLLALPSAVDACNCMLETLCDEVARADAVFIGFVESIESIEPDIMQFYKLLRDPDSHRLIPQPEAKELAGQIFSDVPAAVRDATTIQELETAIQTMHLWGVHARLKTMKVFKGEVDKQVDVWTATQTVSCGINFEAGKGYLIQARADGSGRLITYECAGTTSLSKAGPTLGYFFSEGARYDGRVVSDEQRGWIVLLKSDDESRYTETGRQGIFALNGLKGGEYTQVVYDHETFVDCPRRITVKRGACTVDVIHLSGSKH